MGFGVVLWVRVGQVEFDSDYLDLIVNRKCPRYADHVSTSPARLGITGLIAMRVVTIHICTLQ
jgi:hypothetical protein